MSSTSRVPHLAFLIAALPAIAPNARAQDAAGLDRTPVSCVTVATIARTQIVDAQTVLFFMKSNGVYRNTLQQVCPTLDRRRSISYQTTSTRLGRLCERALVTTSDGTTCRLGPFVPITADEAVDIAGGSGPTRPPGASVEATPAPPQSGGAPNGDRRD